MPSISQWSCVFIALLISVLVFNEPSRIPSQLSRAEPMNECELQEYIQKQDRISSDPSRDSIFNCHSSHGKCKYFRPSHFFSSCGKGKEMKKSLEQMKHMHRDGSLWSGMPPIIMPYLRLDTRMQMKSGKFFDRCNLSLIHVHKCAGTSLVVAFRDIVVKNKIHAELKHDFKGMHTLYSPTRYESWNLEKWNATSEFIEEAVTFQKDHQWNDSNHMIVAVVRDPVERFISAVGQISSEKFINKSSKKLRNQCLKDSASETLQCFVSLLRTNGFWIDLHFTPMVLEISFATMGKDVPVAIFPFEEVPNILASVGGNPKKKKKNGRKPGYRSDVLMNVTMNDFRADVLHELCMIYTMDVWFLRDLGHSTHCDAVI